MSNPLDELLKKYEDQLVLIQKQKEEAKNAFDIACKNEDRFQGAIIGVKDAQAQLLSTKAQEEEIKPSDAQKSS
jgi:outer membrane protein TolC